MVSRKENDQTGRHMSLMSFVLVLMGLLLVIAICDLSRTTAWASGSSERVSIELEELSAPEEEIYIGQVLDRLFKVHVLEDGCYIRLKTSISSSGAESMCRYRDPKEDGWILADDGWWYLPYALKGGQEASFSSSMTVCDGAIAVKQNSELVRFSEITTAEALDENALNPDWESSNPWKGVEANTSIPKDSVSIGDENAHDLLRVPRGYSALPQTSDDLLDLIKVPLLALMMIAFALYLSHVYRKSLYRKNTLKNRCGAGFFDGIDHSEEVNERKDEPQ